MNRSKTEKKPGIRVDWKKSTILRGLEGVPQFAQPEQLLGILGDARDEEERAEDDDRPRPG